MPAGDVEAACRPPPKRLGREGIAVKVVVVSATRMSERDFVRDAPLGKSIAALRGIGYDGYLLVELPPDPADPDAVARHSVQFLKEALHE